MGSGNTKVAVAEPERPSGPPSHGVSGNSVISATSAAQTIKKKNKERFEELSEHGNRPGSVMSGPHDRGSRNSGDASSRPGSVTDGRSSRTRPGSVGIEPNLASAPAASPGPGLSSRPSAAATSSRPPAPSAAAQTARALAATDAAAADVTYELMNARKAQAASFLNSNNDDSDSDASLDNTARRPPAIVTTANGGSARRPATTTSASAGGSSNSATTNSNRRPPPSRAAALAMGKAPISSSDDDEDNEAGSGGVSRRPPSHPNGYEGLRPTTLRAAASPSSGNSFGYQGSLRGDSDAAKNSTPSSSRGQSTPGSARSRGDPTPPSSHTGTPVAGNNINSARGPGYSGSLGPNSSSSGTPSGTSGGDSLGGGKGRRVPPPGRAPPSLVGLTPDGHLAPGTSQGVPRAQTAATPSAAGASMVNFENSANRRRDNLAVNGNFDTTNNSSGMRDPGVRRPRPPSVGPSREPTPGGGKGQQTPSTMSSSSNSGKGGKSSNSSDATSRGSSNESGGKGGVGSSTPGKGSTHSDGKGGGKGSATPRRPPTTNRGGGPTTNGSKRPLGGGFQPKYQPNTAAPPPGLKPRASFRMGDSSSGSNSGKGKGKGAAPPSASSVRRPPLTSPVNQPNSRAATATSRHDSGPSNNNSNGAATPAVTAATPTSGKAGTPSGIMSGRSSVGGGGRARGTEQGSATMVAEMADSIVHEEDGNGQGGDSALGSDSDDEEEEDAFASDAGVLSNWLDEDDGGATSTKKSTSTSSSSLLVKGNKADTVVRMKSPLSAASRAQDGASSKATAAARSDFDAFLDSDEDDEDDDDLNGGGGFRSSTIATTSDKSSSKVVSKGAASLLSPKAASKEVPSREKSDLPQRVVAAALGLPTTGAVMSNSSSDKSVRSAEASDVKSVLKSAAKDSAAAAWLDDSGDEDDDDSDGLGGGGFRSNGRAPIASKPPSNTACVADGSVRIAPVRSMESNPRPKGSAQPSNTGSSSSRGSALSPKSNRNNGSSNDNRSLQSDGLRNVAAPPPVKTTATPGAAVALRSPQPIHPQRNSAINSSNTSNAGPGRPTSIRAADQVNSSAQPSAAAAAAAVPSSQPSSGRSGGNERSSSKSMAPPPPSTPQAGSNHSTPSSSSSTASITGNTSTSAQPSSSPQAPRTPNHVKDTRKVQRKHQSLPENMGHAMPKTGNWAKNRYIVNNYILLDVLGAGSYAEVRLAKDRNTDTLYAVKVIQRSLKQHKFGGGGGGGATQTEEEVKREIAIMKKLNHPHVLRLFEVMDDPKVNKLYLVLDYMRGGDLMQLQEGDPKTYSCKPMNDGLLLRVMTQVVQGLRYLHSQNIIHGDIKPQNVLVANKVRDVSDIVCKIADFGISKSLHVNTDTLQETAGTPAFMSPQICGGEEYDGMAADVWALGGTLYMLKMGRPPFLAKKIMDLCYKIIHEDVAWPSPSSSSSSSSSSGAAASIQGGIGSSGPLDPGVQRILDGMLQKEPKARLTLPQVYQAALPIVKRFRGQDAPNNKSENPGATSSGKGVSANSSVRVPSSGSANPQPPMRSPAPTSSASGPSSSSSATAASSRADSLRPNLQATTATPTAANSIRGAGGGGGSSGALGSGRGGGGTIPSHTSAKSSTNSSTSSSARSTGSEDGDNVNYERISVSVSEIGASVNLGVQWEWQKSRANGANGKDLEEGDDEDDESAEEDSSKGNASSSRKQQGAATNDAIRALEASDDVSDGARDDVRGASGKAGNSGVGGVNSGSGDGGGGSNSSSSYPLRKDNSHDSLDSNGSAPQPVRRLTSEQEQVRAQKFQRKRPSKAANVDDQGNNSTNGDGSSSSRKIGGHGALSGGGAAAEEDESGSDDDGGSVVGVAMGSPGAGARGGSGSSKFKGPNGQFVQKLDSVEFGSIMDTLASQPAGKPSETRHTVLRHLKPLVNHPESPPCLSSNRALHNKKLKLTAAWHSLKGSRDAQEDRVTVIPDLSAIKSSVQQALASSSTSSSSSSSSMPDLTALDHFSFFGVFDGHGGVGCCNFLQRQMHLALASHPRFGPQPVAACNAVFPQLDAEVCAKLQVNDDVSGSTGLVLLVDGRTNSLVIANVGDTRCVLSRSGKAFDLSNDHRLATRPDERQRVEQAGALVRADRVNGQLAITRSFGDCPHKADDNDQPKASSSSSSSSSSSIVNAVVANPEVKLEPLGNGDEFCVIATDGLWDVMPSQQVVNFLRLRLWNHKDLERAARELTKEAVHGQKSLDNVSVVLVAFHQAVAPSGAPPSNSSSAANSANSTPRKTPPGSVKPRT